MPNSERAKWLKSMGLCIKCKSRDAYTMAGRAMCADCAEENARRARELRAAGYGDVAQAHRKALQQTRRKQGLCTTCGRPLPNHDYIRCAVCRAKARRYYNKYRDPETNWPRGSNGICVSCNRNLQMPDRTLCEDCYEKKRIIGLRNVKFLDGHRDIWRQDIENYWLSRKK